MGLELRENNLYVNGRVIEFTDGTSLLVRDRIIYVAQENDDYYTVKMDEELTNIAWRSYRKFVLDASKYWWILADVNNIYDPFDLDEWVGKDLLIPNIYTIKLQLTVE